MAVRRLLGGGIALLLVVALAIATMGLPPVAPPPANAEGFGAAGTLMLGLEEGAAGSAATSGIGWGLSAIGLNNQQTQDFNQIADELGVISDQLTDIENELSILNAEIEDETCALETSESTTDAIGAIGGWSTTLQGYMDEGATDEQIESLVEAILDDTTGVVYQLSVINAALFDEGISEGIISSCLATLATPTSGTAGDIDYFDAVSNLTMYFYTVQVQGLNLQVEALHAQAADAWVEANGTGSLDPNAMPEVCSEAPNESVVEYCNQAVGWMTDVYEDLQAQFAYAGAPYSVYGAGSTTTFDAATINGSPYVFVMSLEDFTSTQGSSCSTPLDSAEPCGPLVGTNLTTAIPQSVAFGSRTNWTPATPEAWQTLLANWTDNSETLGTFLEDEWGFQNTADATKVFVTNTTYTATLDYGSGFPTFDLQAVCFGDTSVERSVGHQPFCYNGSNDGEDYGEAKDLFVEHYPAQGCADYDAPSTLSDEDTDNFYVGTYWNKMTGYTCDYDGWVDGVNSGWVLDVDGASAEQFLWPMFDMSTAVCNENDDGTSRSTTNAAGVYTLCGDDFDLWFAAIVPDPADNAPPVTMVTTTTTSTTAASSAPTATVSSTDVAAGDTVTITTSGWDGSTSLTTSLQSEPVLLDRSTVDTTGTLTRTVTIPTSAELGSHTLHLNGSFRGAAYELVIEVTVRGRAGTLAGTGSNAGPLAAAGAIAALLGAAVLEARRRRHASTARSCT
jgi:hypothetical protein